MNLILYSGGYFKDNIELDKESIALTNKKNPSITYIPTQSYRGEIEFHQFVKHYKSFGIERFIYFPVDINLGETIMQEAFNSDIIYLSGGNTFYFLKYLKQSGAFLRLKRFVKEGGVLSGMSAGGIICTRNIRTAEMPAFDRDDNDEGLKNLKALSLVKFDFFPHYKNSKKYNDILILHSLTSKHPLYACRDGSGLVISNNSIKFVGETYLFYKGQSLKMNI